MIHYLCGSLMSDVVDKIVLDVFGWFQIMFLTHD